MNCPDCGCPMLPKGKRKKENEYDHAQGCPSIGKCFQVEGCTIIAPHSHLKNMIEVYTK